MQALNTRKDKKAIGRISVPSAEFIIALQALIKQAM